jgi:hypothetical protein
VYEEGGSVRGRARVHARRCIGSIDVLLYIYSLVFFKRREHEELKQRKEKLENLEKNGNAPSRGDGTDM